MLTTIEGDILKVNLGIICHQVNCMGKMGAGIALKIRKKWPTVYDDYIDAYNNNKLHLGEIIISTINQTLFVANLCGQYRYGREKKQTNYDAVRTCLTKVNVFAYQKGLPVYIPKNMGCALAGGSWNVVEGIIKDTMSNVTIVNFKEGI